MSSIDSKFAKSLQIHTLDNIVFQKRQRKSVNRPLYDAVNHILNSNKKQQKKNTINQVTLKVNKSNKKNESKSLKGVNKLKLIKKRKYLNSKDLLTTKKATTSKEKIKQNHQHNKSNTKTNLNEQKLNCKIKKQIQNQNQKKREKSVIQIAQNLQNENIVRIKSQKKSQLKNQTPLLQPKSQIIDTQIRQNKQVINIPKKLGRPRKQVINQNQNAETPKNQTPFENSKNIIEDNLQKSPLKSRALGSIFDSSKKQVIQVEQTPKPRQAKLNALKKYTQKQFYPQDSFEFQREFSYKRKKISKAFKPNQYSMNRIFRKQPKLDLNPINIEVKLDKLNLDAFKQKFGTFDVIHCSLPLSIIWELSSISNLMIKGFIFIWVEKGQTALGYHLMKRLGYDVIDQIVWVKSDENTKSVFNQHRVEDEVKLNQNNIFLNSKSVCFVGYKYPTGQKAEYRTKISNNLIFSRPNLSQPLQKPEQIYEIGDLLMPGSRKLQLGGKKQNGWVSLHHNQTRIRKCVICLCQISGNNSRLFTNQQSGQLSSVCQNCFSVSVKYKQQDHSQQCELEEFTNHIANMDKTIEIKAISYSNQTTDTSTCTKCKLTDLEQSILCSCSSQQTELYCKQCFAIEFNSHLHHFVKHINIQQKVFLPSDHLFCSLCHKNTLSSHFYQCIASSCRNKNHLFCQECFWKSGYQILQNQKDSNQSKRKKNNPLHQFKLRKINSFPAEKVQCSHSCKQQLQLPHFVCETCVGWRWCGKCNLNDENHCLDFETNFTNVDSNEKHVLSLIS